MIPHSKWIYYYPDSNFKQKEEQYVNGLKNGISMNIFIIVEYLKSQFIIIIF